MATFEIKSPSGETFEVTAPDDASKEDVLAYAQSQMNAESGQQEQPAELPGDSVLPGNLRNIANNMLMGFGSEVAGGMSALYGAGRQALAGNYDKILPTMSGMYEAGEAEARRREKKFAQENPGQALTGAIVGGVASPASIVLGPYMAGARGAGMLPRMGRAGAGGGLIGGMFGAGHADPGERMEGAAKGAAFGAGTGPLAVPAVDMVAAGARALANQTINRMPFRQAGAAERKVAEALTRDGWTPDQAAARVQQFGPEAALMDAGPNTRALMAQAYQTPGEGKAMLDTFLTKRQEGVRSADKVLRGGQVNRVTESIDDLVPENYYAAQEATIKARKGYGSAYDVARGGDDFVDVAPVLAELDAEIMRSKGGIKTGLQRVRDLLVDDKGQPEIAIDTLHQAKMAVDDLMTGEGRSSIGNVAKGRIREYQNKLLDAIEASGESGAAYRAGRQGTAGEWAKQEALEKGSRFMSKSEFSDPQAIRQAVEKMTPEEKHMFRVGAAQAIKAKLESLVTRADATKKIMDIPALEQKIRLAFGDDDLFRQYISRLEGEKEMFKSYAAAKGNSATAERLAAMEEAKADPGRIVQGIQQMASVNPLDWVRGGVNLVGGAKDRLAMPAPQSGWLAEMLTRPTAENLNRAYQQTTANDARRRSLAALLARAGAITSSR